MEDGSPEDCAASLVKSEPHLLEKESPTTPMHLPTYSQRKEQGY